VEVTALIKTYVFLRPVAKMSNRFSEQRINITLSVKLGKDASDSFATTAEDYGGEFMKESSAVEWHKRFKEGQRITEYDAYSAHHFL
jgi:hypothetical protein